MKIVKESIIVMTFILGLSISSYFLTKSEKERNIASGTHKTSVLNKVPVGYQK